MPQKGQKMSPAHKAAMLRGLRKAKRLRKLAKQENQTRATLSAAATPSVEDLIISHTHGRVVQLLAGVSEGSGIPLQPLAQRIAELLLNSPRRKQTRA
jgi:hypothetical protein